MENEKKQVKKIYVVIAVFILAVLTAVGVFVAGYITTPTPKKTALAAMECLAKGETVKFSQLTSDNLSHRDFFGIHIISYKILSESSGMVKHEVAITRYEGSTDTNWDDTKNVYRREYPDYVAVVDTANEYVLQSPTENIEQTLFYMDVEYSDITGDVKRVGAYVTVEPETPGKHDYVVTEITGIY